MLHNLDSKRQSIICLLASGHFGCCTSPHPHVSFLNMMQIFNAPGSIGSTVLCARFSAVWSLSTAARVKYGIECQEIYVLSPICIIRKGERVSASAGWRNESDRERRLTSNARLFSSYRMVYGWIFYGAKTTANEQQLTATLFPSFFLLFLNNTNIMCVLLVMNGCPEPIGHRTGCEC